MNIDQCLPNVNAFIFFVGGMFYKNVRNRRGDEGDEMVGRKGRRFWNDGHLYGH